MLTSLIAAWIKKQNYVEKINDIDKYVLNINRLCEELEVQFTMLNTDRINYKTFRKKYISEITSCLSSSPVIPPKEWKDSIRDITLKYPELINPDDNEDNKLWPWFGDLIVKKDNDGKEWDVRRQTAFMYTMRHTKKERIKSSCCFKKKRQKRDIYK